MPVDDVTIRAKVADELSRPAKKIEDQLERTGRAADKLANPRRTRELGRMDRVFGGMTRTLGRLDRGLMGVSRRMGDFVGRQLRRATVGIAALTVAVGGFGLKSASNFEQTQIAFEGLLGSAEKGQALFASLQEYNKKSPFELADITGGARQLLGFQFEERQILPLVKASADAASALGAGAAGLDRIILNLGQVRATGKVTGRELRDFATVGFPGYALVADILGGTREEIEALGDDAEVSADRFLDAVMKMQGPLQQFSGMAEKQQKSLAGLWSNIKDIWQINAAGAMGPLIDKLGPMLDLETGSVPALIERAVTTLGPEVATLLGLVVDLAAGGLPLLEPVLTALISGVSLLVDTALPGFVALEPVADELAGAIGEFFAVLAPEMPVLVRAFVDLVGVLPEFVQLLGRLATLVTPIAGVVSRLLALEGADRVVAGLLATLLGYRALHAVVGTVSALATAFFGLATAQTAAAVAGTAGGVGGVGRMGRGGMMLRAGSAVAGGALVAGNWRPEDRSFMGDVGLIGGATAAGFGIGGPWGALAGGVAGTSYVGAQRLVGAFQEDQPAPYAHPEYSAAPVTIGGDSIQLTVQTPDAAAAAQEVQRVLDQQWDRRMNRWYSERDRRGN